MKKVVVAEASPTIKSVADSLLRQNGYDVVCTSDGLQAWEVISSEKPDLVLIGQGLSGMSGLELCRQISSDRLTGGIPVVLMIGGKDAIDKEQILASGARGTLRKPFSPKDLLDVTERLAGQAIRSGVEKSQPEAGVTSKTKYTAQVSSTQHLRDKKENYNLEWLDLSETNSSKPISKVVSFDLSAEDQGLIIDDDQYGLARPLPEPEPEQKAPEVKPEKDEDYEWFLGEIKKEMEGKNKTSRKIETDISASSIPVSNSPLEPIRFDDLTTADEPRHLMGNMKPHESSAPLGLNATASLKSPDSFRIDEDSLSVHGGLSDDEISILADRIALRLAAHLAATLDKNMIIEAIKAALK
jgi:CheY-like chemotaxis protein